MPLRSATRISILLLAVSMLARSQGASPRLVSTVHIRGVDVYGKPTGPVSVDAFIDEHGKNWANSFKDGVAADIPVGNYSLEASHSLITSKQRASVSSRESWFTIAFESAPIESDTRLVTSVSGVITGLGPATGRSCELVGLFIDMRYGAALRDDGSFDFGLVVPGLYLMSCFKDSDVVFLHTARIEGGQPPLAFAASAASR